MTGVAEGRAARVPVLIGTTADEFNLFTALQLMHGRAMDAAQYPGLLAEAFGPNAGAVARAVSDRIASAAACRWRIRPR